MFIAKLIEFYTYIVFASVIVSWLRLPPGNPIVDFLDTVTEPALKPIRDLMPDTGGLDFSPIVLLVLLQVVGGMFV